MNRQKGATPAKINLLQLFLEMLIIIKTGREKK